MESTENTTPPPHEGAVWLAGCRWFTEPEDEAVGVVGRLMNGRLWLRRLAQLASLGLLLQAAPNPDWAAVLGLLFLASSSIS